LSHNNNVLNNRGDDYLRRYSLAKTEFLKNPIKYKSVAKSFGLDYETFKENLRLEGFNVPNQNIDYRFDERIFETIDSEEKAYWFGVLYADGNTSSIGNKIEITLKDEEHLYKFKEFLNCSNNVREKIVNNTPYYRISKRNVKLWEDLVNHGCIPNKSLVKDFPIIEKELLRHFVRGYFDGNGCISIRNDKVLTVLNSSELFLSKLIDIINFPNGITHDKRSNAKSIRTANPKYVMWFLDWMYKNSSVYLERKYDKYNQAIAVLNKKL